MSEDKLKSMRYAGNVNKCAIVYGFEKALPGTTLLQINNCVEWYINAMKCKPAFKNYKPDFSETPYPATACISVNDVAVHGIPGSYVLQPGDLLTIDVGSEYNGWYVDSAMTRIVPGKTPSKEVSNLLEATQQIMLAQLAVIKNDCSFYRLIEVSEKVASFYGVTILPQYGGHHIGNRVHIPPFVPNAINRTEGKIKQWHNENSYREQKFITGQTVCIEPVVTLGSIDVTTDPDGWTVRKLDGNPVAHIEHCLLITDEGNEILS